MVPGRRIYFRKARGSTGKQHPAPAQSSDFCNLGNDTAKTNSRPIPPGMLTGLIPFVTDMDRAGTARHDRLLRHLGINDIAGIYSQLGRPIVSPLVGIDDALLSNGAVFVVCVLASWNCITLGRTRPVTVD